MTRPNSPWWLRTALRAYPPQWRATRENELLGVLRDSVPDRPFWPGLRVLLNLVASGWRTRLRLHPPFWRWVGYRFFGKRLPAEWHEWVRRDADGRLWWFRRLGVVAIPIVVLGFQAYQFLTWIGAVAILAAYLVIVRESSARTKAKWLERYAPVAAPPVLWAWNWVWRPAPVRTRITSFLIPVGIAATVGAPVAAWALLYPNAGPISAALAPGGADDQNLAHVVAMTWTVVAVGLAVLLVALPVLFARVPARLATRQSGVPGSMPSRQPAGSKVAIVVVAQLVAEMVICAGQLGDLVPAVGPLVIVAAGLALGPAFIALGVMAKRAEAQIAIDVTWYDVRQAVFGSKDAIRPEVGSYVLAPFVLEGPLLQP